MDPCPHPPGAHDTAPHRFTYVCALCHPRLRLSLPQELPEVEYCAEVMQDHPDDAECTVCLEAYEPGEVRATS